MEAAKARAASLPPPPGSDEHAELLARSNPYNFTLEEGTWSGAGSKWASSLEGFGDDREGERGADGAAAEADGHDAWASHLSELIAEADAAPFADGVAPDEVFGAVKPYIDEALKDEHAERIAAADARDQREGDDNRAAADGSGAVWRFGDDD